MVNYNGIYTDFDWDELQTQCTEIPIGWKVFVKTQSGQLEVKLTLDPRPVFYKRAKHRELCSKRLHGGVEEPQFWVLGRCNRKHHSTVGKVYGFSKITL